MGYAPETRRHGAPAGGGMPLGNTGARLYWARPKVIRWSHRSDRCPNRSIRPTHFSQTATKLTSRFRTDHPEGWSLAAFRSRSWLVPQTGPICDWLSPSSSATAPRDKRRRQDSSARCGLGPAPFSPVERRAHLKTPINPALKKTWIAPYGAPTDPTNPRIACCGARSWNRSPAGCWG